MSDVYDSLTPGDRDGTIGDYYRVVSNKSGDDEPTDVEPREPANRNDANEPNTASKPEAASGVASTDPIDSNKGASPTEPAASSEPNSEDGVASRPGENTPPEPVSHASTLSVYVEEVKPQDAPNTPKGENEISRVKVPLVMTADDLEQASSKAMQAFQNTHHNSLTADRHAEVRAAVMGAHKDVLVDDMPDWFRTPLKGSYSFDADPHALASALLNHRNAHEKDLRDMLKAGLPTPTDPAPIEQVAPYADALGRAAGQEIRQALVRANLASTTIPIKDIADAHEKQIAERLKALNLDERHLNLADTTSSTVAEREFVAKALLQSNSVLDGPHPIGSDSAIDYEKKVEAQFAKNCIAFVEARNEHLRQTAISRGATLSDKKLQQMMDAPLSDEDLLSLYAEARLAVESDYRSSLAVSVRNEIDAREAAIRQALESVLYKRFVGKEPPVTAASPAADTGSVEASEKSPGKDEDAAPKSNSPSRGGGHGSLGAVTLGALGSATTGVLRLAGKGLNKTLDAARTAARTANVAPSPLWGTPEPSQPAVREYRKNVATAATLLDQLIERGANETPAQRQARLQHAARYMDRALISLPMVEGTLEEAGLKRTKEILSPRLDKVSALFPEDKDLLKSVDNMREKLRERIAAAMERIQRVVARITDAFVKTPSREGSRGPRM